MVVTEFGMVIVFKLEHLLNEFLPMEVTEPDMVRLVKPVQPEKV